MVGPPAEVSEVTSAMAVNICAQWLGSSHKGGNNHCGSIGAVGMM